MKKKLKKLKKKLISKKVKAHVERLAVIDIGSNAIRMLLAEKQPGSLRIIKKFRFPIRLGADVFASGQISGKNLKESARTFKKFKNLADDLNVHYLRAVGTSALREAKNSKAFLELIRRKSGIKIEIIDGTEEAKLIYQAVRHEVHLENQTALLIDVGGGSVELTLSENAKLTATHSFPFGTVRTLQKMKKQNWSESQLNILIGQYLESLTHFIQTQAPSRNFDFAVGTGGNLESLIKLKTQLLNSPQTNTLSLNELQLIIAKLSSMSYNQRVEKLKLRPDRADVILPAAMVVQAVLRQAKIDRLVIPQVGLKDGLLWSLTQKNAIR